MKKRLGIFLFYDKDGIADRYISFLLNSIRKSLDYLIIIVKDRANEEAMNMFETVADEVHICDITFAKSEQYKYAILTLLGNKKLAEYDSLVLMDDSFFGPFISFDELFKKSDSEKSDTDFLSLSAECFSKNVNTEDDENEFKLDTYFLIIKSKMLHSDIFYNYWNELPNTVNDEQNIDFFDNTFTSYFQEKGWIPGFLFDSISYDTIDNTLYNAKLLIENGFPIVKRDLFLANYRDIISQSTYSDAKAVIEYLSDHNIYDVDMIFENIIRYADPYNLSCIFNLNFILPENYTLRQNNMKLEKYAILVVHLHYDILFDENLKCLSSIPECVDLIITTTSVDKEKLLTQKISDIPEIKNRTRVLLSIGAGRDMAGLLVEAREYIMDYQYIGFTHDKMSLHHNRTSGQAFARIIFDSIVGSTKYIQNIFTTFEDNPHIGLLVPPAPEHGRYFATIGRRWTGNYMFYRELCSKLNIPANTGDDISCMALGTAFWCRRDALSSLFSYPWTHSDFPKEPLPLDGSISHAIERCFPFIAKHHGYMTGFIYNQGIAAEYLNNREYILVDYLTTCNNLITTEGTSLESYTEKLQENFNIINLKQKIKLLKREKKNKPQNIKIIRKSKFFDRKWYLETYPDVRCFEGTPEEHYLDYGWLEGKNPSPLFNTEEYLKLNIDVLRAKINPLLHYERNGRFEGRQYSIDYGDYRKKSITRGIKRRLGRIFNKTKIRKNANARILVVLHLFYMCSWKEIKEYLMNLDAYNYDLVITYTQATYKEDVFNEIRSYKPDVVLQECDNVGYDVWPYIAALKNINLDDYDIIFKLQSKGVKRKVIYIYGQYLKKRDWFINLYEGCLGAFTVHKTIDKLMNASDKVGIVAAKNLILKDPTHKQHMVLDYMKEIGMQVPKDYLFVSGTCFAVRAGLMKPIQDMHYQVEDFSGAGAAFSIAHKLERIICLTILNEGYHFSGNSVMRFKRWYRKLSLDYLRRKKYNGVRILNNKNIKLDDEFVYFSIENRLIKKYEIINLPLSEIKRRWINNEDIPLSECHPYRYLVTKDPDIYQEYCDLNKQFFNLDIMSRERFDLLMKSIDEKGFENESVIVVNEDNIIMDGQHRCCYMMYKFGEEYKIPVLRVYEYHHVRFIKRIGNALERILPERVFKIIFKAFKKTKYLLSHS